MLSQGERALERDIKREGVIIYSFEGDGGRGERKRKRPTLIETPVAARARD